MKKRHSHFHRHTTRDNPVYGNRPHRRPRSLHKPHPSIQHKIRQPSPKHAVTNLISHDQSSQLHQPSHAAKRIHSHSPTTKQPYSTVSPRTTRPQVTRNNDPRFRNQHPNHTHNISRQDTSYHNTHQRQASPSATNPCVPNNPPG